MSFRNVYGYDWSENGWRMCNRDECDIVRIPELYLTETAPIRKGAPLTILGAWMYWYDRNVEEILTSIWGWSAGNDVANSNHLSGTAIDLCAPKYPWGSKVMPAAKVNKVIEGLKLFSLDGTADNSLVFWGRTWSKPDEMHYQMHFREGDPRNEQFAQKLRDGYLGIYKSAPPVVTPPVLDPIARHQKFLKEASERELMVYIAEQLGPGHPEWPSKGKTLRDKVFGL
ncbi:lysin A [Mycobacterium phage Stephig9]|uniref:Lysin A n=1 Tax=Mycobacterium phage Stephig9 TaxID=2591224 RepID=A0A514DH66_9CAUD|nr:lysin A [Mycobacterium phage Stephig9]